ncbi:MAG TPA: hypothetical protein VMU29_04660 [Smithella sp.]|nr:hypothetical protein [Smithella sp.]
MRPNQETGLHTIKSPCGETNFGASQIKEVIEKLNSLLESGLKATIIITFPIWKTLKLGTHKSKNNLIKNLIKKGVEISDSATRIMNELNFSLASVKTTVDIVNVSLVDLGLNKCAGATLNEICARANQSSLSVCPLEAVLQLRLRYNDQPEKERLNIIVAGAVTDPIDKLNVFRIGNDIPKDHRDDALWIDSYDNPLSRQWHPYDQFVFICRK